MASAARNARRRNPFTSVLRPKFPTNGPRVAWFIENYCTHTDGVLFGSPMILEPWQRWVLNEMFRIDPDTGLRYWREVVLMVPRGNGKSALVSALGFYFLIFDGEGAPEVYSVAWGEDQARAVFDPAKLMWEASPHLQRITSKFAKAITCPETAGTWQIVSRIAETKQGKKPYALLNDEFHVHKTPELRDTFIRGMHKRLQPIAVDITTEGRSRYSPLGELQRGFHDAVEAGTGEHEELGPYLHTYRAGRSLLIRWGIPWGTDTQSLDIENPRLVRACNPLSVIDPQRLIDEHLLAPGKLPADFITYHLNGLVENTGGEGIPLDLWESCQVADASIPAGSDVVIGIDAGYRRDCSAVLVVGWVDGRIRVEHHIWRPPRDEGLELDLEGTIGATVDDLLARYRVRKIVGDPALLVTLFQRWQARGLPVRDYRFAWGDIGPDSVRLLEALQSGTLAHDGDAEFSRHVLNMRVKYGPNGAWKWADHPDKGRPESDVPNDAGIALTLAVGELLGDDGASHYGSRGLLII